MKKEFLAGGVVQLWCAWQRKPEASEEKQYS